MSQDGQKTAPTAPEGTQDPPPFSSARSAEALRNLGRLVRQAARELRRLKEENAALSAQLKELEAGRVVDPGLITVTFDEEPEELHHQVKSFIKAIDTYLAETSS